MGRESRKLRVVVASKNPVKLAATERAFRAVFPDESFVFLSVNVPSGVADQPMSDVETLAGATRRSSVAKLEQPDAHYWVGLEGGVEDTGTELRAFAWMVVQSATQTGRARCATFTLPPAVAKLIREGIELGEADDRIFQRTNSKHKDGASGLLTNGHIPRVSYYEHALIFALVPFIHPEFYPASRS